MHPKVVLYDYAMKFAGLPYRWGGDDAIDGFDCSGFCIELLQAAGVIERGRDFTASGLWALFSSGGLDSACFGALAFYGKSPGAGITHVGFCINEHTMLEAGGGGSKTTTREAAAAQNAFIRLRPIASRADFVGLRLPPYPWKG